MEAEQGRWEKVWLCAQARLKRSLGDYTRWEMLERALQNGLWQEVLPEFVPICLGWRKNEQKSGIAISGFLTQILSFSLPL
jgi:hypothetical protein